MKIEIEREHLNCEICGRSVDDFDVPSLRKLFKCPHCNRSVCAKCLFEHTCGFRLCVYCLYNVLEWRRSKVKKIVRRTGGWHSKYYYYEFDIFEHPWGAEACPLCNTTGRWYSVHDIVYTGYENASRVDKLEVCD